MLAIRPSRRPRPLSTYSSETNLPSNLLDDVTNESGALAQVTLGPADAGLDDASSGFL